MRSLLLAVLLASCALAGPRKRALPKTKPSVVRAALPASPWTTGRAGQVLAARVYLSSGRVRVCLRFRYAGQGGQPIRLEIGRAKGTRVTLKASGVFCELFSGVMEKDEARLVLDAPLAAELAGDLYVEDNNP